MTVRGSSIPKTSSSAACRRPRSEIENFGQYDYILVNDRLEESIDILKSIVKAERLKRSRAALTSRDQLVLAVADRALRQPMMQQVETILATFDLSRFPAVTE